MVEFLVEAYHAHSDRDSLVDVVERASAAAAAVRQDGIEIRYVRTIHLPDDEICFHLEARRARGRPRQQRARADRLRARSENPVVH